MSPTTTISAIEIVNISKDIAQLNLGYLGISVGILGVLGGVFVYFNIRPLKDALDKQEDKVNSLKKEASELLSQSGLQTKTALDNFKSEQVILVSNISKQQKESIDLELVNKIQETESSLLEKIESTLSSNDAKLKEIILSEVTNRLAMLEKDLTATFNKSKVEHDNETLKISHSISKVESELKDAQRDIKELKVYKFSKEGKMGAVVYSIDLLKGDIDEKRWSILKSLERLKNEIDGVHIEPQYIADIEEQLSRIASDPKYTIMISEIRAMYSGNANREELNASAK